MTSNELYGLALERFTEERNALVKRLRADQRRDEAAEVAKLRKPSVAGWAVNQLVRTQRRAIDELFRAGDALQKAQADLLDGRGNPGELRTAVAAERSAVDELVAKARGLLTADGHELTDARLEQVADTLHASALDEAARAQVQDGCLVRELRHVGLGALPASPSAGRPTRTGSKRSRESERARESKRSRESERARAEAKGRAARVKAAEKRVQEARRALERAVRDADTAAERRERAAEALRAAEQELADAG